MEKVLLFESNWRTAPGAAPSQPHSVVPLYRFALQQTQFQLRSRCLLAATLLAECRSFLCLPENQRGVNLLLFSTHGEWLEDGRRCLAAADRLLLLEVALQPLRPHLSRTLLVLDACQVGRELPQLCQTFGLLGAVGFAGTVNWTASSAFILSLLRQWVAAEVLHLRRASSRRPAQVMAHMQAGSYAPLMQQLGVQHAWKHQPLNQ